MQNQQENKFFSTLINSEAQIGLRYQAVFQLKNINTNFAIQKLVDSYQYLSQSILLSHEVLYTLGQLDQDKMPIIRQFLISVVKNENDNNLSRHQAAQALANYFLPQLQELYLNNLNSSCKQLKWTCQIALQKVRKLHLKQQYGKLYYKTKQPAAPYSQNQFKQFLKEFNLEQKYSKEGYMGLLLENISLFNKYRILYKMRNENNKESRRILCQLLSKQYCKTQTSLLKHEICFILGQIGCEQYQDLVRQCIQNQQQQSIVRHEALAAVASQSKDYQYLKKFLNYPERLIRQSAQVAQFQIHYWND